MRTRRTPDRARPASAAEASPSIDRFARPPVLARSGGWRRKGEAREHCLEVIDVFCGGAYGRGRREARQDVGRRERGGGRGEGAYELVRYGAPPGRQGRGTAGADGLSGMMAVAAAVVVVIIDGEEEGSHSDSAARETASRRFLRWRDAAIPVDGKEEEDEEDEEEEKSELEDMRL